jgi:hypothetical protein
MISLGLVILVILVCRRKTAGATTLAECFQIVGARLESCGVLGCPVVDDFPADRADAGFQTQAAYHLLKQRVIAIGHDQVGLHLNFVAAVEILTVERLEGHRCVVHPVEKQSSYMGLIFTATYDEAGVVSLYLGVLQRLAIYLHCQGS